MTRPAVTMYEIGAVVRDALRGVEPRDDLEIAVEADSYEGMRLYLRTTGFKVALERPRSQTVRAGFPSGWDTPFPRRLASLPNWMMPTAEFTLCRRGGPSADPHDEIAPGDIYDELSRRDFTINAIARTNDGHLLDPWHGERDIAARVLRTVGNPQDRLRQSPRLALRAVQYAATLGFEPDAPLTDALRADWLPPLIATLSPAARATELDPCLRTDTPATLRELARLPRTFTEAVFSNGLVLEAATQ